MKAPFEGCDFREYPAGSVTQFFGENPKLYASMGLKAHNGTDLVAEHGTLMLAIEEGTVVDVNDNPKGYGKHLRIITRAKNGLCNEWTYGHCDDILVEVGMTVKEGEPVATMGNTGFVVSDNNGNGFWSFNPFKGTHLHLGLRKVRRDPKGWSYKGSKIKLSVPDYGNGYKGAIDPLSEFKASVDPEIAKLETTVSLLQKVVELYKQLLSIKK